MPTKGVTTTRAKDGRKRMKEGVHLKNNNKGEFIASGASRNGHIIFKLSEGYTSKANAKKALMAAKEILEKALAEGSTTFHDHTLKAKAKKKA